ncbi:MAG: glutamine synthetase family protein [Pseudomonadota bacterium]
MNMDLEALKAKVASGDIDTVVVCMVDMQGRLVGKRFQAQFFIDSGGHTHACDYLLANDITMEPVPGYEASSWERGYGDFELRPDMSTLRELPWQPGTALVLCDVLDHHGAPVPHSPRAILKRQLERLDALGYSLLCAPELEFYLFEESHAAIAARDYRNPKLAGHYIEDYHVLQTSREEPFMRAVRNGLEGAGVPVENTKGEWGPGQGEINVRYGQALVMADRHALLKNAIKEIAAQQERAVTFMAKWRDDLAGNSCHIHLSLWDRAGTDSRSFDDAGAHGMSPEFAHFVAGLLANVEATTLLLAPNVNSYKRFQAGTFAPTTALWSLDNRTAGFRLVGGSANSLRIECRVGGADLNPYLAYAGLIAAGIDGLERRLTLPEPIAGDLYEREDTQRLPADLAAAAAAFESSAVLREALTPAVVDHYAHAARWEIECHQRAVSDWELARGLEQA